MDLSKAAKRLGLETCLEFDPKLLIPQQKVRAACVQNKCGSYGNNYMCPPHIGEIEDIKKRLQKYRRGILLQYSLPLNVRDDLEGLLQSKLDFQHKVLRLERSLRRRGVKELWGMIGGNCGLCMPCLASIGEPCLHPEEARASLESIGIDVLSLLNSFGLDSKFHDDKITWTGCILFNEERS